MKIIPNYQLKAFNYAKLNNQPLQTNPNFGNKKKLVKTGAKAAAVAAGTILAMQNGKNNEVKLPTREEFIKMLKDDGITDGLFYNNWLEIYDRNPENAVAFFTMTDKYGERCVKYVSKTTPFIESNPKLAKEIIDTETDTGTLPFSINNANKIITWYNTPEGDYTNGIRRMLSLKDEIGNLRFSVPNDYIASWAFEKYPEIATKYANAKDNRGNYRFSSIQINDIIRNRNITNREYPSEKVDEFMNLQRPDGSYVNDEFYERNFEIFMKNPKEYEELCNISTPDNIYIYPEHIENLMPHYIKYPEEIKEILQTMPRFSTEELTELGTRAGLNLHNAPKSFKTLANLHMTQDKYAFSLEEICDIIQKFELGEKEADNPEEFKATLRMLSILRRI